jgi:serine/threonine-protein kinase
MLDPARWERIQAVFHQAVDLPEADREAFVTRHAGDDPDIAAAVMAMLADDERTGSLLARGAAHAASQVLGPTAGSPLPGDAFGPYRIKALLGEGGMGVVYLGERDDLGSVAAIKILRDASLSPSRRDRFTAEQRTLAQLRHPSIAQLHDAGTLTDGTPWFVMEYVEGLPLTDYCRNRQSSLRGRVMLWRSVCQAVQHAHSQAVIHRDLKPSNILVKTDGTIKLLDFGIAKHLDAADGAVEQTRTGLRLMTPAYAAPEQVRGQRVGIRTDVYSLGVVFYELLTGKLPFDLANKTPGEAELIITEREPEKPSLAARRPDTTGEAFSASADQWADLDVLCLTAMHKDPNRRYQTVEALIRDIDHFLAGEPLEARPDSARYRLGKFVRRHRQAVITAGIVVSVLVGLVIFYTVRLTLARNTAVAEAARTQRIQRFMLNLFDGGDQEVGPADSLRVVTLVDRGLQEARGLDAEPAVQAELYLTLGGLYQRLGNLARADTLLRAALDQRRRLYGPRHPEVAASLVALGRLRLDQAAYQEAEALVREGLAASRETMSPENPAVAMATQALGEVHEARGRYDSAVVVLEEAVRLFAAPGVASPELATSLYQLASSHFYAGHYDIADSLNRRVLAMHQQLFGANHPNVADDLVNLGAAQFERGRYPDAERFYTQALETTEAWYGKEHYKTAANLTMISRALIYQNRFDEAKALLQRALAIRERVFGKFHPQVASSLNELANVAYQRDQYDEAETTWRRVVEIYRTAYAGKHYLLGIGLSNLASVYMDRGQHAEAERLFREALAVYHETLAPDHTNVGIGRIKLGRVLRRQGRFAEAVVESLAGYDILVKQTDPASSFIRAARLDLAASYDSLKQPDKSARFKAELADSTRR